MKKVSARQENIELLRIIATLMVLINHALRHGGVLEQYEFNTVPYMLFYFLDGLCYVAVDVFILITGYFMVCASTKPSRILKFVLQVEAFSILCFSVSTFVFQMDVHPAFLLQAFFPLSSSSYWFASEYIVLLVLTPILNKFIHMLDRQAYRASLILLITVFSVVPSFAFWSRDILSNGHSFVWFIVLYLTAGYIRLYWSEPSRSRISSARWLGLYLGFILVGGGSRTVIGTLSSLFLDGPKGEGIFFACNSVVVFPAAVCLFMAFREIKIHSSLLIRLSHMGVYCFGAYLATDHSLIREPLWNVVHLFDACRYGAWTALVFVVITVIIMLLLGCSLEFLRSFLMDRLGVKRWATVVDSFFMSALKRRIR